MKVLLINGSPRPGGCTYTALNEIAKVLKSQNIETEIFQTGSKVIRDCIGCGQCTENYCIFSDDCANSCIEKAKSADGFVFGTPVYFAHPTGRILSLMDRIFHAGREYFVHKPAAVIASARRAGTTAALDVLSKHLGISQMPIVSSSYWNMVHGNTPLEVRQDFEGMQTMRNIGLNMAWLLKCIEAGKKAGIDIPETEHSKVTNFIRQQ